MKALAIDSAVSRLIIAAKNEDKFCSAVYDIGMKQSETLVNAIDYVLEKTGLTSSELDYTTICAGPGSFTGLRLGFSALKALNLAFKIPLYSISSLEAYSYAYKNLGFPVLCGIDANKDRFYARLEADEKILLEDGDYEIPEIVKKIEKYNNILICGPDTKNFIEVLKENGARNNFVYPLVQSLTTEGMFEITDKMIENGTKPLEDYDGPVYLRASEAEIKLKERTE